MSLSRNKEKEIRGLFQDMVDGKKVDVHDAERILKYMNSKLQPIKPRSAKNKGKKLQNLMCDYISRFTGIPWGSGDEFLIRSREMGLSGVENKDRELSNCYELLQCVGGFGK